jgi:nucleotide-binding universal stress UspA family protein
VFERVLVAVDGRPESEGVLDPLLRLARGHPARFFLTHPIQPARGFPGIDAEGLLTRDRDDARAYLRDLMGRLAVEDVGVAAVVREGNPVDVLLQTARERGATMIAACWRARGGLERRLMGDPAGELLRRAELPVLLFREGPWTPEARPSPRRLLLASRDGAALPVAAELARELGAHVVVLHVAADPGEGRHAAEAAAARLAQEGVDALPVGASGDPALRILETAGAVGAELVAIGARPRGGWSRLVFDGVAERVLRASSAPLLVVPRPAA